MEEFLSDSKERVAFVEKLQKDMISVRVLSCIYNGLIVLFQTIEKTMSTFGDDSIKQPEEFFATFEQFLARVDEARAENDQAQKKEEEERKKREAAAEMKRVRRQST